MAVEGLSRKGAAGGIQQVRVFKGFFLGHTVCTVCSPLLLHRSWWALREGVQGVKAPRENRKDRFDPMGKFHIPDNSPYMP